MKQHATRTGFFFAAIDNVVSDESERKKSQPPAEEGKNKKFKENCVLKIKVYDSKTIFDVWIIWNW